MTELFNGGEMDSFLPTDSTVREEARVGMYNTTFARCALRVGNVGGDPDVSYADTIPWSAQTSGFYHTDFAMIEPSSVAGRCLTLHNASGEAVRIVATKVGTLSHELDLQYLDSLAAWQSGGTVTLPSTLQTLDIRWNFAGSGNLDLYVGGTARVEFTGDLSHLSGVTFARKHALFQPTFWSQAMADTESTIGHRLYTIPPASNGANTAWTGTYTEVDEVVYDDGDFINSGTANQVETFAGTTPTLTGYVVQSVTVAARGKTDGSGPANLQLALRSSSTDYFSASNALGLGYGPFQEIWETNPATSAAWVNTAVSGLQFGVKSIT